MDWVRTKSEISPKDRKILRSRPQESKVVVINSFGERQDVRPLVSDKEWNAWLDEGILGTLKNPQNGGGVAVILGGRADGGSKEEHNPASLNYLPFSQRIFSRLVSEFSFHGSMIRTINRGHPTFARTHLTIGSPPETAIVYNCRSYHGWPGDLALSITYFTQTKLTYAIILGCDAATMTEISGRLGNADGTLRHPLLLVGIFAEIERKRHLRLVKNGLEDLLKTVSSLSRDGAEWKNIAPQEDESRHAIDPWLEIHYIKNGLENWRNQLLKMVQHVDELPVRSDLYPSIDFAEKAEEPGVRIQERLREIICDYDEKIRECEMIMEGMALATSLAHTKANMDIALSTKKDGSQMKSIALLTMVFLPATFVASLFSMTFFQWIPDSSDETVSPYLWIYFVVTVGLTLFTVGLWYLFANRQKGGKDGNADPEKGMSLKESIASLQSRFNITKSKRSSAKRM